MGFIQEVKNAIVGQRRAHSYRGLSLGYGDSIKCTTDLYYSLYRKNTDLRRCVEELYQGVNRDGYVLKKDGVVIENESLNDILTNQYPFDQLIALMVRDLTIGGNIYMLKLEGSFDGNVIGIQMIDPRTIRIVANKYGEVLGYVQQTNGTGGQKFDTDEILHSKDMVDHDNEIFGIGKVETLVYDIMGDIESGKSNYSYFKNNAIPASLVILDNDLDEKEVELAMEQLKDQFTGGNNQHKISAAIGIKDIKVLGSTMKDMEFTTLRGFTTERICSATGVPKTILGYSDNVNFSTSDNQYRKFIENTIRPLRNKLQIIFNDFIGLLGDEYQGITLEFLDNFDFDLDDKIARIEKLTNVGLSTLNEGRTALGKDEYPDPLANMPIIKQGYEFVEDIGIGNITNPTNDAK